MAQTGFLSLLSTKLWVDLHQVIFWLLTFIYTAFDIHHFSQFCHWKETISFGKNSQLLLNLGNQVGNTLAWKVKKGGRITSGAVYICACQHISSPAWSHMQFFQTARAQRSSNRVGGLPHYVMWPLLHPAVCCEVPLHLTVFKAVTAACKLGYYLVTL